MLSIQFKGFKIEALAVGLQETEIIIDGKYYDTYYGNHNEYSKYISPLCDDIRAGFVPFVGWPEENEDDAIFAEGIDWDGEPELTDCPDCGANIPNDGNCWYCEQIPFLGEPMHQPDYIGESGL